MPPIPLASLAPFAPYLTAPGIALLAVLLSLLTSAVVRGTGIDAVRLPGLPAFRWSKTAGALTLAMGLAVAASAVPLAREVGQLAAEGLVRVALAGACLCVGAWAGHAHAALEEEARERAARERNPHATPARRADLGAIGLAAGGAAALVALAGPGVAAIIGVGVVLFIGLGALQAGASAEGLRDLLNDLAAGIDLRARLGESTGAEIVLHGAPVVLAERPGLVRTRVLDGTEIPNRTLLAALTAPAPPPALTGPPAE